MGCCSITQGAQPGALWQPEGWDGVEGGGKIHEGERHMYTYDWFTYCCVPEARNYCKAVNLQLKINLEKNWLSIYYTPGTLIDIEVRKICKIERKEDRKEGRKSC